MVVLAPIELYCYESSIRQEKSRSTELWLSFGTALLLVLCVTSLPDRTLPRRAKRTVLRANFDVYFL